MIENAKAVFSGEGEQEVHFNISVDDGEMTVGIEFEPALKNDDDAPSTPQVILAVKFMEFLKS